MGAVVDYLSDSTTTTQWDPGTLTTVRQHDNGEVGTTYLNTSTFLGRNTRPTCSGAAAFRDSAIFANLQRDAPAMAQSLLGQFARPHARDRARVLIDVPNSLPMPDGAAYGELNVPTPRRRRTR